MLCPNRTTLATMWDLPLVDLVVVVAVAHHCHVVIRPIRTRVDAVALPSRIRQAALAPPGDCRPRAAGEWKKQQQQQRVFCSAWTQLHSIPDALALYLSLYQSLLLYLSIYPHKYLYLLTDFETVVKIAIQHFCMPPPVPNKKKNTNNNNNPTNNYPTTTTTTFTKYPATRHAPNPCAPIPLRPRPRATAATGRRRNSVSQVG